MDASSNAVLAEILQKTPHYINLAVADASGRVVSSARPFTGEVRVDERPFFRGTLESRSFAIGVFFRNPIAERTGLNMGCPLLDPDRHGPRRALGVPVSRLDRGVRRRREAAARDGVADRGFRGLRAHAVARRRPVDRAERPGHRPLQEDRPPGVGDDEGARRRRDRAALRVQAHEVRHGNTEVFLSIGIPTGAANRLALQSLSRNLAILLVGALGCLGLAWLASERFFLRETRALLGTARRMKAGDSRPRTGLPEGRGELREVAMALDSGLEALSSAQAEMAVAKEAAESANRAKSAFLAIDEPRDPHADERRHQHDGARARHATHAASAAVPQRRARVGAQPARHHQRHPRLLEDRGREAGPRGRPRSACARARRGDRDVPRQGGREARRADRLGARPTCPDAPGWRRAAAPPGADEPGRQRLQVHRRAARWR